MASSRDDFIIAIRSAFLKRSTQQKFSLLTLLLISAFVIILSSLDFKVIRYLKIGINEVVYRSSFIVSIPENFLKKTFIGINDYSSFYKDYRTNLEELNDLKSKDVSNEIIKFENQELKELINDYVSSSDKILAKIIVDHQSPYLRSIIINKGSKDNIKIGTNIYDQSYLVGRVIEVNYKTSRVLLLTDLNSNVPVTIVPQNIQAILTGNGDKSGEIKYIKSSLSNELSEESIIYTSGTGAIFKSGVPVGKLRIIKEKTIKLNVEFYSDFSQLKYVFAEVISKKEIEKPDLETNENENISNTTINAKIKILEDEIKIIEETNIKLKSKNEILSNEINQKKADILKYKNKISAQAETIKEYDLDTKEMEFLKMNLYYGHKCRRTFINVKGFTVGTEDYKSCVLRKGRKD
ncbi:rod shape-determining protein MreC [Candidatus Pelagibacter sp.]|nr:rod shape-determining protein MreC [Candidatus Pelagibacter sp.]